MIDDNLIQIETLDELICFVDGMRLNISEANSIDTVSTNEIKTNRLKIAIKYDSSVECAH